MKTKRMMASGRAGYDENELRRRMKREEEKEEREEGWNPCTEKAGFKFADSRPRDRTAGKKSWAGTIEPCRT